MHPAAGQGGGTGLRSSIAWWATGVAVVLIGVIVGTGAVWLLGAGQEQPRRAIIVDQLSLTYPDGAFIGQARDVLTNAGYTVDYVPGEDVTVDTYRDLPRGGYDIVLLRSHSGRVRAADQSLTDDVILFTGQPFNHTQYLADQSLGRVGWASYGDNDPRTFFGVTARFVREAMRGSFSGSLVLLMGCDGFRTDAMAQAFHDRGAGFVSWDKPVSVAHTDEATMDLLNAVLESGTPLQAAAAQVSADPYYGATLKTLVAE